MGRIEDLFTVLENEEDFRQLDSRLTKECETLLHSVREKLTPWQYEQVRDAAFSVAYIAKKSSFEIGFKTAMKLIFECRGGS